MRFLEKKKKQSFKQPGKSDRCTPVDGEVGRKRAEEQSECEKEDEQSKKKKVRKGGIFWVIV